MSIEKSITKSPNHPIRRFVVVCRVELLAERNAGNLSKDDLIDMQGTVVAVHSGGLYRVQCDAGHEVLSLLQFGHFNACPETARHVACAQRWERDLG